MSEVFSKIKCETKGEHSQTRADKSDMLAESGTGAKRVISLGLTRWLIMLVGYQIKKLIAENKTAKSEQ